MTRSKGSILFVHYGLRGLVGGSIAGFGLVVVVTALLRSRKREPGPCPLCEPGGWRRAR